MLLKDPIIDPPINTLEWKISFSVSDISPNIGKDLRETEPSCFRIVLGKKSHLILPNEF